MLNRKFENIRDVAKSCKKYNMTIIDLNVHQTSFFIAFFITQQKLFFSQSQRTRGLAIPNMIISGAKKFKKHKKYKSI